MHRRYNLAHLILADVIVLILMLLMVCVDAKARIAFMSDRDWHWEIYVMDADGANLRNLTNSPHSEARPAWLNSPFSVSPAGKKFTMWGRVKQVDR